MSFNRKSGITVTSIVVYVILFFLFTTVTTVISSRFNKTLFDDRGKAINVTAMNKLEYNLLNSAKESEYADIYAYADNDNITVKFSNNDTYYFNRETNVIYKNGGKLVKFLKDFDIKLDSKLMTFNITLNKYTNELSKKINIECINHRQYAKQDHLIAHYDAIDNVGTGTHSNTTTVWKDLSGNNYDLTCYTNVADNGIGSRWKEKGFYCISGSEKYWICNLSETISTTTTSYVYFNGINNENITGTVSSSNLVNIQPNQIVIGTDSTPTSYVLSNVRIYDVTLTEDEITINNKLDKLAYGN